MRRQCHDDDDDDDDDDETKTALAMMRIHFGIPDGNEFERKAFVCKGISFASFQESERSSLFSEMLLLNKSRAFYDNVAQKLHSILSPFDGSTISPAANKIGRR